MRGASWLWVPSPGMSHVICKVRISCPNAPRALAVGRCAKDPGGRAHPGREWALWCAPHPLRPPRWACTRASRLEVWALPPLLHGAVWRTRDAEEGTFGAVDYASTILRYVRDWSPSDPPRPAAPMRLNPHTSQDSRGVAYRPKGTLFRTARAPCCPVKDRGRCPDLEP